MRTVARAPGKLVVLGEYAVLAGAPALVLAVDRYCRAEIGPSEDARCHILTKTFESHEVSYSREAGSGLALIDSVVAGAPAEDVAAWRGTVDSRAFFAGDRKLGLGSSAAALTVWAAVWAAYAGHAVLDAGPKTLQALIELHRAFQGGAGSGLDVAASLFGGVIRYEVGEGSEPRVSSVKLPNSVRFAGVFVGASASTPDFLGSYEAWRVRAPEEATGQLQVLNELAAAGSVAAAEDDADGFLAAVAEYGRQLGLLGAAMGADVVTAEHHGVAEQAERFGVAYKVSGAGGGDLGLAFSADPEALEGFKDAVGREYQVMEFGIDPTGLILEETTE